MEFSVGNVLGTSFKVWFRNFIPFLVLGIVIQLPLFLWLGSILTGELTTAKLERLDSYAAYGTALEILLNMLLTATLIYGVAMELRGSRATIGRSLVNGLVRALPALLVTILMFLAIGVGLILLIVPGLYIWTILFVSVPASVVERPGIRGALSRSAALTEGHRGQMFGLILLVHGSNMLIGKIIERTYLGRISRGEDIMGNLRTFAAVYSIMELLFAIFAAVVAAVAYAQLRHSKEGTTADELARVFD